jgi:glycosyltransferase involved in cell wall biosynthesis
VWPTVAVIVPARQAARTLPASLAAISDQTYPGEVEVAVAVGPSTDGTADLVRAAAQADPRIRLVDNPAGHAAAGLNAGIAVTEGGVVARVDAHAVLPPGYLRRAVELLDSTGADEVGGIQDAVGTTAFEQAVAAAMRSPFGAGDAAYRRPGPPGPVDTVYLGVFRRGALERVGGYDEALVRNQDYELNVRLREVGGTVYFHPDLRVEYRPRGSVAALARQYHDYGRWKRATLRRHPGSLRWRQLAPPAVVAALAAGLAAAPATRGRTLAVPAGYAAGVTTAGVLAGGGLPLPARAWLPVVLATMHLAWGAGFLRGVRERSLTRPRLSRSLNG